MRQTRKRKTPWQRIKNAADRGTGLRLSPDDVRRLGHDGAIMTRAELDDEEEGEKDGGK